jgi:hypothetical protein
MAKDYIPLQNSRSRLKVLNFDSTVQSETWSREYGTCISGTKMQEGNDPNESLWNIHNHRLDHILQQSSLVSTFAGILRTAHLYSEKIVLSSADIFDGIFFLALGPKRILELLGLTAHDVTNITVVGREKTLNDAFISHFTHPESGILADFVYSSLLADPYTASYYGKNQKKLKNWIVPKSPSATGALDSNPITPSNIISTLEKALDFKNGDLSLIGRRWQEWLDSESQGTITYQWQEEVHAPSTFNKLLNSYKEQYGSKMKSVLHSGYDDERLPWNEIDIEINRLGNFTRRSKAFISLQDFGTAYLTKLPFREQLLGDLRNYYQLLYLHAMAGAHNATLISFNISKSSLEDRLRGSSAKGTITLQGSITESLSRMPTSRFSSLEYEGSSSLSKWRHMTSKSTRLQQSYATWSVAYLIDNATEKKSLASDIGTLGFQLLVATLLAAITAFADNIWFAHAGIVWIIVFAFILGIIPNIIDWAKWLIGLRSAVHSVVYES